MYEDELKAIKKFDRYREKELYDDSLIDLASNDYLSLSEDSKLYKDAYEKLLKYKYHAPKASQLVNGYHKIHRSFEKFVSNINGFESCLVVGSGFLANIALIESLPRHGDILILDEEYHSSGILASKLSLGRVFYFKHNDSNNLKSILDNHDYKRAIVCVEGVYSMSGDLLNREIFDVSDRNNVILIVDEAHSSGVVGKNLLGIFDLYNIDVKENHIKMGTLGKAYGSYGAFILANIDIINFLQNRAKSIIYTTAPSIFDTSLALEGIKKVSSNIKDITKKIERKKSIVKEVLGIKLDALILKIELKDSKEALKLKNFAQKKGILIGAIRPPTVKKAMLRIIPRIGVDDYVFKSFLMDLKDEICS